MPRHTLVIYDAPCVYVRGYSYYACLRTHPSNLQVVQGHAMSTSITNTTTLHESHQYEVVACRRIRGHHRSPVQVSHLKLKRAHRCGAYTLQLTHLTSRITSKIQPPVPFAPLGLLAIFSVPARISKVTCLAFPPFKTLRRRPLRPTPHCCRPRSRCLSYHNGLGLMIWLP